MFRLTITNETVTEASFNGNPLDHIYYNTVHVWPDKVLTPEEIARDANKKSILESDKGLSIYYPTNNGQIVYDTQIKNTVDGYSTNSNGAEWGYYWTPDYEYFVVYHTGHATVIKSIEDVLARDYATALNIELDEYSNNNPPPTVNTSQILSSTRMLHICINGDSIADVLIKDTYPTYTTVADTNYQVNISWYVTTDFQVMSVSLVNRHTDEYVLTLSIVGGYLVKGYKGGVEITDHFVNFSIDYITPEEEIP